MNRSKPLNSLNDKFIGAVQMIGRKRKIPYRDLVEELQLRRDELFDSERNLHVPSHPSWASIAEHFEEYKVSAKHIWTLVKYNRLGDIFNDNTEQLNSSPSSSDCGTSDVDGNDVLEFKVVLSTDEWNKLYMPDSVLYRGSDRTSCQKSYSILKPGLWTGVINERIIDSSSV